MLNFSGTHLLKTFKSFQVDLRGYMMALIKINPQHVHAVGHLISLSHSVRGNRGGGKGYLTACSYVWRGGYW